MPRTESVPTPGTNRLASSPTAHRLWGRHVATLQRRDPRLRRARTPSLARPAPLLAPQSLPLTLSLLAGLTAEAGELTGTAFLQWFRAGAGPRRRQRRGLRK